MADPLVQTRSTFDPLFFNYFVCIIKKGHLNTTHILNFIQIHALLAEKWTFEDFWKRWGKSSQRAVELHNVR